MKKVITKIEKGIIHITITEIGKWHATDPGGLPTLLELLSELWNLGVSEFHIVEMNSTKNPRVIAKIELLDEENVYKNLEELRKCGYEFR